MTTYILIAIIFFGLGLVTAWLVLSLMQANHDHKFNKRLIDED